MGTQSLENHENSPKTRTEWYKKHRTDFKPPQKIVLYYFGVVPGGLTHFGDPILNPTQFFDEKWRESTGPALGRPPVDPRLGLVAKR